MTWLPCSYSKRSGHTDSTKELFRGSGQTMPINGNPNKIRAGSVVSGSCRGMVCSRRFISCGLVGGAQKDRCYSPTI